MTIQRRRVAVALTGATSLLALTAWPASSVGTVHGPIQSGHDLPIAMPKLVAVSAVSPHSAIAVGFLDTIPTPQIKQWDGDSWTDAAGIDESTPVNDVAALSSKDAWAVGGNFKDPRVEHWNGHAWRVFDGPGQRYYALLMSVTMLSSKDVWAVGYGESEEEGPYFTLVEHWDGASWTVISSPSPYPDYETLTGVTATSDDDVWAVGDSTAGPLILHWDGTSWTQLPSNTDGVLRSISAVSPDDVWVVGEEYVQADDKLEAVTQHWDGTSWSAVQNPIPRATGDELNDVSAVSADDVWAVGSTIGPNQWYQTHVGRAVIEHWDGQRWTVVHTPHPKTDFDALNSVSADSSRDAWAVGYSGSYDQWGDDAPTKNLLLHWDGTTWTRYHG